jgi:DNA polymerase-4
MTDRGHDTPRADELPAWEGRAILHVDMDAFFCAVEVLDDPSLAGKPIIVGGSPEHRGVVSTASYEARVFGVRSAMPSAQAKVLCPQGIWVTPTPGRYGEVSRQVRAVLADETPRLQMVSIDEGYLDVTPGIGGEHPVLVARRIQARIDAMGLSCSVGVASARVVAKIASDRDKPHGITVVWPGTEAAFLAPLDVGLMPGIGPAAKGRLATLGIKTLGQLAALDDADARTVFGNHGPGLVARARGEDPSVVRSGRPVKSLSKERTFSRDIRDEDEVFGALSALSTEVGARLRRKGLTGRTVHVKARFGDFSTRTAQRTLPVPTDLEQEFGPVGEQLMRQLWSPGVGLRLIGIGLSGFDEPTEQLDLFAGADAAADSERDRALARGMDAVRERFGSDAISRGPRRRRSSPMEED